MAKAAAAAAQYLFPTLIIFLSLGTTPILSFYTTELHHPSPEKLTKIRAYIHDTLSGDRPTAVQIARPNTTNNAGGATPFGSLFAIDDPLTDGPQLNTSKLIGNAKGMYLSSSLEEGDLTLVMYVNLAFTGGEFNGSSVSVFSRNPVTAEKYRELAIVGGTGKLRYARGFVNVSTVDIDLRSGDAVLLYDINVVHH